MKAQKLDRYMGVALGVALVFARCGSADEVELAWDAPTHNSDGTTITNLAGFRVYVGHTSSRYDSAIDVGNQLTAAIPAPIEGQTYFFAVQAYNLDGATSLMSDEVAYVVADRTAPSVSGPASLTLSAGSQGSAALPDISQLLTVSDNCTAREGLEFSQAPAPGTRLAVGTWEAVVTVRDEAGNTSRWTSSINVQPAPEETPLATLTGQIQYAGRKSGKVTVLLFSDPRFLSEPVQVAELTGVGSYRIENLAPGTYYLLASMKAGRPLDPGFVAPWAPWGVAGTWSSPAPVVLAAGETVTMDIALVDGNSANPNPLGCRDAPSDFDGDGISDQAVYTAASGLWTLRCSRDGERQVSFGYAETKPVTGDFDNDGRDDLGVYDPAAGTWYVLASTRGFSQLRFGYAGTQPVPADYDGDGQTDLAVYDPVGVWYIMGSARGFWSRSFGYPGAAPVPADYDGDGVADVGVYDASTGYWYLDRSSEKFLQKQYGYPGTLPVAGDFDGDGSDDITVYDPRNGFWSVRRSSGGKKDFNFGFAGTLPAAGDFDGDSMTDIGVYSDSLHTWYTLQTRAGYSAAAFGAGAGALPVSGPR